jgi:non-ribosomal peptide synthase protein (TIGR01720 family)
MRGENIYLGEKSLSYQQWANYLRGHAQTEAVLNRVDYWLNQPEQEISVLPVDFPEGINSYGSTESLTVSLDRARTRALIFDVPKVFGCQVHEVLLLALFKTLNRNNQSKSLLIELEGHGREAILPGIDISRTIGWFTSIFPFYISITGTSDIAVDLQHIKILWENIPGRGLDYGLFRYAHPDKNIRDRFASLPTPEINFNYLGQFGGRARNNESNPANSSRTSITGQLRNKFKISSDEEIQENLGLPIRQSRQPVGPEQNPDEIRSAKLYVVAIISDEQLAVRWLYSREIHKKSTITGWVNQYMHELRLICKQISQSQSIIRE